MEGVRTFLESSTIHGLTYISTTRKYHRLFWMLVVLTGFGGASYLIKGSFDSWSESPIKTTIETLPIAEIKLPKVIVCPPKNTFTDLNYDLMMVENMTLTEEMRNELFKYAVEVINEDSFSLNNWTKIHEEDRFYNWYHGYTEIKAPSFSSYDDRLYIDFATVATSGAVTTEFYREQFKSQLVERKLVYTVKIHPPFSVMDNENLTLHFKVEKVSMTGLSPGSKDEVEIDHTNLDADQITANRDFKPPGYEKSIKLSRDVSSEDVESHFKKLNQMPGFKFSWWYSGMEVTPDKRYEDYETTKLLVR